MAKSTPKENQSALSARFAEERSRLGISQKALGDLCGVSREMVGRYERGDAEPGAGVLVAFQAAGADVAFVLSGERNGAPGLTGVEQQMLNAFRSCDEEMRKAVAAVVLRLATAEQAD